MSRGRHSMMCGLVTDRSGNQKIILAGGHSKLEKCTIFRTYNIYVASYRSIELKATCICSERCTINDYPIFSPDYNWDNVGENRLVESFDMQTEEWSSEPPFPFTAVGRCTNIPYGNSFLSIGGSTSASQATDYIYTVNGQIDSLEFCTKYVSNFSTTPTPAPGSCYLPRWIRPSSDRGYSSWTKMKFRANKLLAK